MSISCRFNISAVSCFNWKWKDPMSGNPCAIWRSKCNLLNQRWFLHYCKKKTHLVDWSFLWDPSRDHFDWNDCHVWSLVGVSVPATKHTTQILKVKRSFIFWMVRVDFAFLCATGVMHHDYLTQMLRDLFMQLPLTELTLLLNSNACLAVVFVGMLYLTFACKRQTQENALTKHLKQFLAHFLKLVNKTEESVPAQGHIQFLKWKPSICLALALHLFAATGCCDWPRNTSSQTLGHSLGHSSLCCHRKLK